MSAKDRYREIQGTVRDFYEARTIAECRHPEDAQMIVDALNERSDLEWDWINRFWKEKAKPQGGSSES